MTSCVSCHAVASRAIFLPSLAEAAYVVAVCDRHDVLGDGDDFSFEAMAANPAPFIAAFDRQQVEADDELRDWLLERSRGVRPSPVDLLTTAQVAERIGVSERTVQRRIHDGELAAVTVGGVRRVRPDDLDPLLKSSKARRRQRPAA